MALEQLKQISPWSTKETIDYFIEISTEDWVIRSNFRYKTLRGDEDPQPFTLKFLTSEFIKKQQYLAKSVKRLQCLRGEWLGWRDTTTRLWRELRLIEAKTPDELCIEVTMLIKNQN